MATIKRFENLEIWKLARQQALTIYELTLILPFSKDYEIINQIRRSSGSVMDNIAEGFERFSNKEFSQHLVIAKGSNGEVRSQLYRAFDRHHISQNILEEKLNASEEIGNKLSAFIKYLNSTTYKTKPAANQQTQHPTSNIQLPTVL